MNIYKCESISCFVNQAQSLVLANRSVWHTHRVKTNVDTCMCIPIIKEFLRCNTIFWQANQNPAIGKVVRLLAHYIKKNHSEHAQKEFRVHLIHPKLSLHQTMNLQEFETYSTRTLPIELIDLIAFQNCLTTRNPQNCKSILKPMLQVCSLWQNTVQQTIIKWINHHQIPVEELQLQSYEKLIAYLNKQGRYFTCLNLIGLENINQKHMQTIGMACPYLDTILIEQIGNPILQIISQFYQTTLKVLSISHSPNLTIFPPSLPDSLKSKDITKVSTLPQDLEILKINGCMNLTTLPDLPYELRQLHLNNVALQTCPILTSLSKLEKLVIDLALFQTLPVVPSNLKTLELRFLNLTSLPEFPNDSQLETFHINCKKLEKLPALPSTLKNIYFELKLDTANDYNFSPISNLLEVHIQYSPEIKNLLFPPTVKIIKLSDLKQLQTVSPLPINLKLLDIQNCTQLVLPPTLPSTLKCLHLYKLISLKTLSLPLNLEKVIIVFCSQLQTIQITSSKLKELQLRNLELESIPSFSTLEILNIETCTNLKTIPNFSPYLKKLHLYDLKFIQALPEFSSKLKQLTIINLPALNTLPSFTSNLKKINLNQLNLKELSTFPNRLKTLNLENLVALQSIATLSLLSNLTSIYIGACSNLTSLSDLPPKLKNLHLSWLPKLETTLKIPQTLEKEWIMQCPNLKTELATHTSLL